MKTTRAIQFSRPGGPVVLDWTEIELKDPAPHEVQISHTAIGLNYIDTYHRSGAYPVTLPSGIGLEAAGHIRQVGSHVKGFQIGDRVAYLSPALGAYSEIANIPEGALVPLPDDVPDSDAAAILLKGLTAHFLIHETFSLDATHTVLIHAAAGGVGQLLCQWAKHLGAQVFGTVGSPEKARIAKALGCDHVILYNEKEFDNEIKRLTANHGVDVVYDSIGATTFMKSLDCLKTRGLMVSFGNASGPPPKFDIGLLAAKGSLFVTRPTVFSYISTPQSLRESAANLFNFIREEDVSIDIGQTYALKDAAQAHEDLEARKTTGSTLLIP